MDNLNDWFPISEKTSFVDMTFVHRKQLKLENGAIISVQASEFHYCSPRENFDDLHKYDVVEAAIIVEGELISSEEYPELGRWWGGDSVARVPINEIPLVIQIARSLEGING